VLLLLIFAPSKQWASMAVNHIMNQEKQNKRLWIIELIILIILTILLIGAGLLLMPQRDSGIYGAIPEPVVVQQLEYGIIVDSMDVIREVVKKNEFLADILLRYDVDYNLIDAIARSPRDVFDVRKIRAGYPYSVILTRDSVPLVQYLVY